MIIVLVIAVWIVLLWLVAGLCASARVGDRGWSAIARRERAQPARPQPWEAADAVELHARARAGRAADQGAQALQGEGLAA